jgi:hypothetical protein
MTNQTLTRARPERSLERTGPAAGRDLVPVNPGVIASRRRPVVRPAREVVVPRPRALRASRRPQLAHWRARNWRRVVLAWFVLSLAIVAVAAEPATAFPKAQVSPVAAVRMALRVIGVLTVAGVPAVLVALP